MRRSPLALVAALLLAPVLLSAPPAEASTTTTSTCTDAGHHVWKAKATWGSTYTSHGVRKVSAKSVRFTTKAKVKIVDYTVTVVDGHGATVQRSRKDDKKFSFKKGKRYLDRNPTNPLSSPARTKVVLTVGAGNDGRPDCTITFTQPGKAPASSSPQAPDGSWPSSPPARICGSSGLSGPAKAPAGAVVVPKGDNSGVDLGRARTTYWFAPGTHTLGSGEYDQVVPGAGSTFVGAPGAVLDGQGKNQAAFGGDASGVTIRYLTVRGFVGDRDSGTVNHDSAAGWTVEHSTITGNGGAGLFLGSGNHAAYNCLADNGQYGFQVYGEKDPTDVVLDHNEISGNNTGDWETKDPGCGCTGGGKLWAASHVQVTNNYVHNNASVGLWADTNNDDVLFEGNWISDNDSSAILYEISYNAAIRNNVIRHNQLTEGPRKLASGDTFPDAAIYISESGGESRLSSSLVGSPTIDISGNLVDDNYNGVTLWENADRFCASPANTSSGDCTKVGSASLKTCGDAAKIKTEPAFSDCRWKTQDVQVHHNTFSLNRSHFFGCAATLCGRNALLSNYGSYPDWSPYLGDGVAGRVTFDQGNRFSDNTYVGDWHLVAHDPGTVLTPAGWRAGPYDQDAGSTFR